MVLGGQYLMFGQQDAQYTQYMYNTFSVNPAYAGSREVLSISALHRSQWVGRDGAPNNKLSFGLKAGGHLLNLDFNNLRNFSAGGTAITDSDLYKKFTPNFGAGLYYHNDQFYAGLSIPNFLQTEHFDSADGNDNLVSVDRMTWYLISGYVFEMSSALKFKPAFLLKATSGAPLQADISANFLLNDKFSMGAAYRWDAALSALFGFQMTPEFMLGLAYDSDISELGGTKFNNGSFEVFLRYEFIKKDKIDLTPRFF